MLGILLSSRTPEPLRLESLPLTESGYDFAGCVLREVALPELSFYLDQAVGYGLAGGRNKQPVERISYEGFRSTIQLNKFRYDLFAAEKIGPTHSLNPM